ncbi:MAG: sodium:proton antiporter NhaD [Bacteroidales bacterium]|nr:sodium:proton antiporter NhaD [Bacteroidales bacterium]
MQISMIILFVVGYMAIAFEHLTKVNKAAVSLLMTVGLWVLYSVVSPQLAPVQILHQLGEVSSIVCFIFGAMVVVEMVDCYGGFSLVAHVIKTKNRKMLLLILSVLTFFMSATLDNMTTTIIMIAIMYKLIQDPTVRLWFASIIVLAANAGGAWSPIGDVTTIMLWVKGNVTSDALIPHLIVPSIVSIVVPLLLSLGKVNGNALDDPNADAFEESERMYPQVTRIEKAIISFVGVIGLVSVPIFKALTGLPPFVGVMMVMALLWLITEVMYTKHNEIKESNKLRIPKIIKVVDIPTVLFFFGILMAVGALQEAGLLKALAAHLDSMTQNVYIVTGAIGVLSSMVDNVPLVAAAMGMYPLADPALVEAGTYAAAFVQNGKFWELLAYCAGVGGSLLIIGSAAGVVAMGMTRLSFGWYLKNITWRAFLGYIAGILVYILML